MGEKNILNIDNKFSIFKKLYKYKKSLSESVFPFMKAVLSISEYVIIDKKNILFYTLEEDGIINYPEIDEFQYLYKS